MNDILLDAFGEDVVLTVSGEAVPARAEYRGPWAGNAVGGMQGEYLEHRLLMQTETYNALGASGAEQAMVRGVQYRVTDVSPDEAGMTRLILARFR